MPSNYSATAYIDPATGQPRQVTQQLNSLISSGQYRDIPTSVIPDYLNGRLDEAGAVAAITGSPVYDPTKGPQYDFGQGVTSTPPDFSKLNSSTLAPVPSVPYKSTALVPVPDVTKLDSTPPDMQLTQPEGQASDLTKRLQELNKSLVGESTYRSQQENAAGIPDLVRTQNDLAARLTALKNEAASIPLKLEEQSAGRGITTTILGRQQEKLLRENAIQSLATSSLLEASRGNLTLAMDMVDRAVKARFDPIREEIAANKVNLDLIINSPEYTVADKNRATKQQFALDERKRSLDKAEDNQKDVYQVALEAAKNGADALTLRKIQAAKNPTEAIIFAGSFVSTPQTETVQLSNGADVLIDKRTGRTIKILGGPTPTTTNGTVTQNGVVTSNGKSTIVTLNGKPLTEAQSTSLGYAQRMADADATIAELGSKFTGSSSYVSGNRFFPNILKSDDRQKYEQAQRNFVNAVLRKESGAAISDSEFKSASQQYFPQPGDSKAVIEQKAANRTRSISNLAQSANVPLATVKQTPAPAGTHSYDDYLKAIGAK